MREIIRIIILGIMGAILISFNFANEDSTRATGIDKFDVDYLPIGNKCWYSIGFVLGYHEWYLRKYVWLVPVQVDVDSIIDQANISTFGCSYDVWKNYLDSQTEICKDIYLKESFLPSKNLWIYNSWVFLSFVVSGQNIEYSGTTSQFICLSSWCEIEVKSISDIVSNKDEVVDNFPIILSSWDKIKVFSTWILIYSWWNELINKFLWNNVNLYSDYLVVDKEVKESELWKKFIVSYKYFDYKLWGEVIYDLKKLYNYDSFRNLWHGLDKVGNKLVIKPIWGKNYIKYKSVDFSGSQIITEGEWQVHDVSEYPENKCQNEYYVWSWWWVSRNDNKWVTSYAQSLWMNPSDHEDHQCASTWLIIKNPYFHWVRTDRLFVKKIIIWIDSDWQIIREEQIDKCDTDVLNWQKPKDAKINVDNLEMKIDGYTAYKDNVNKQYVIYATNTSYICFNNIKIEDVPIDFVWDANNVTEEYKKITAIQMVVRRKGETNNIGESNKHILAVPISKNKVPTTLNGVCFSIDRSLNWWENPFKKVGEYWFLLKFWSDDEIRGYTPLMTIKVIPNNDYKFKQFNFTVSSPCKADWKCKYTVNWVITDSFDNRIDLTINNWSNSIVESYWFSNTIDRFENNNSFDNWLFEIVSDKDLENNWYFKIVYTPYNKKVVNNAPDFKIKLRKRNLDWTLQDDFVTLTKSVSIFQPSWIFDVVLTWPQNIPFGSDVSFKLKIKNLGQSKVESLKIKFIPKFTYNGNDLSDKISFVPASGDNNLKNLLNWNYGNVTLNAGNENEIIFTGRLELNWDIINPKINIGWQVLLDYSLEGEVGTKDVKAYYGINSNLSVNYRWVYVEWLFSNSSKWLYELLRKSDYKSSQMWKSQDTYLMKNEAYNNIIRNVTKLVRWLDITCSNINGDIKWICYNNWDITINWWTVKWKSLIFAKWWNIVINWNIKKDKSDSLLTIVAVSDDDWNWWHVYIANNVTNIDAIIVTEKWVFPIGAKSNLKNYMLKVVKWNKNSELNNQLVIYGLVISRWNTIWWSIKINWKYVLPWGKEIEWTPDNFYRAAIYDLNYLRRYHKVFNLWKEACDPRDNSSYWSSCNKLDQTKYWTFPVVIIYDPAIKIYKPYGF